MMIEAQRAEKRKQAANAITADGCGTSKQTRFSSICQEPGQKSTTCPRRGNLPRKKGKKQNAQTVELVVTGRTLAITQRWFCMLSKMQLQNSMQFASELVRLRNLYCAVEGSVAIT